MAKDQTQNTNGVQETLEVVRLVHSAYTQVSALLETGEKVNAWKLVTVLLGLNGQLQAATDNIKAVGPELANLTRDEFMEQIAPEINSLVFDLYKDFVANVA